VRAHKENRVLRHPILLTVLNTNTKQIELKRNIYMDDLLDKKSDQELLLTLLKEVAKGSAELKTADADLAKASNRIRFCLVLINRLLERTDQQ